MTPPSRTDRTPRARRASHSMEAVVAEAVALLDEAGEQALTFRALAARLGGGVASIYWYVSSKDELLDRAADHVLAEVVAATDGAVGDPDPLVDVRTIAVTLFDAIIARPWLPAYFLRDTRVQPHGLRLYDRLGQQVLRLGLGPKGAFDAVSAVIGYVVGVGADLGRQPPQEVLDGTVGRDELLGSYADDWRALDPEEYPFLHHVVEEFATHDDTEQFAAGLDLLLAGLRLSASDA